MISKEDIQKLAELSRIKLTDTEIESLQKDISGILDYVGQVSTVQGSAEKDVPLNHNVMRDDTPYGETSPLVRVQDKLIEAFPKSEKGYNVVRKIIQKDE